MNKLLQVVVKLACPGLVLLSLQVAPEKASAQALQCRQLLESKTPPATHTINVYRHIMAQVLVAAQMRGDFEWSSKTGGCMTFPAKWKGPLQALGSPVKNIGVQFNSVKLAGAPETPLHFFLVDSASAPGHEIIIDPTYKQFFKSDFPEPDIFIGTRQELEAVFVKYRHLIFFAGEAKLRKVYDPISTVEVIYGYGRAEMGPNQKPTRSDSSSLF